MGGFGHPQPHPDGEQLPDGQDVFGRILHRGDDGDTDRAALRQQQPQELFYFGRVLAVADIGGQRRDFIDDQHDQRLGSGRGVQAGVTAQPLRALPHHGRDGAQQRQRVLAVVVGEPGEQCLSAPEFHAALGVDHQQAHPAGPHTGCQSRR